MEGQLLYTYLALETMQFASKTTGEYKNNSWKHDLSFIGIGGVIAAA